MTDDTIIDFAPRTVAQPGSLIQLCQRFLHSLGTRGYAENTVRAYKVDLEQLVGYAASRDVTLVQHLSGRLMEDWVLALVNGNGVSRRTAARKLESVRSLVRFCMRQRLLDFDPTEGMVVKFDTPAVIAPTEAELMKVLDAIPTDTLLGVRDRALFRLLFDSGMRVGGVVSLDVFDAQQPPQFTVAPDGVVSYRAKGGKRKTTVVDDDTLAALDAWLAVRHEYDRHFVDALFLSSRGARMTRPTIHARLKAYGKQAGMPHVHCHLFRHRRLGEVYERTGDIRVAADMGGHENYRTFAEIYGLHTAEARRHKIKTLAPLGASIRSAG